VVECLRVFHHVGFFALAEVPFPEISWRVVVMLNYSRFCVTILLIGGLLVVATDSSLGADKKKKKKHPPTTSVSTVKSDPEETKDKPAIESGQLRPGGYRGLLVSTPNEGDHFRVAVEYQRLRVKRGKEAEYDRMRKDSVNQAARATANEAKAESRAQMAPHRHGRVALPDRREISGELGMAVGSATKFAGENTLLMGLLEMVSDTQTVIFHGAPTAQVRILKPSGTPLDSTLSTSKSGVEDVKKKQEKIPLPGHEGKMKDLKLGQRILVKLAPANNEGRRTGIAPGSIYKRLVELVVVEEEAQPSLSSK
jgi:hypothetical protein